MKTKPKWCLYSSPCSKETCDKCYYNREYLDYIYDNTYSKYKRIDVHFEIHKLIDMRERLAKPILIHRNEENKWCMTNEEYEKLTSNLYEMEKILDEILKKE